MADQGRKDNESFDSMLSRFKQECAREGIISEIKKHEYFFPPSVRRRKKAASSLKKRKR
jgi:small subunit ribosomal protein S21